MDAAAGPLFSGGMRMFILSFTALFLELMVIRWVPSEVRLVAYYANLMLISSFLGLGIGALLSGRQGNLLRLFPLLFAANLLALSLINGDLLPRGAGEFRFAWGGNGARSYASLLLIFTLNAAMFAPLGEAIGRQFNRLPALKAYTWDLVGSLSGTLVFGFFSLFHFSPLAGLAAVAAIVLSLGERRHRWWGALLCAAVICTLWWTARSEIYWSPYYYITIGEADLKIETDPQGGSYGRVSERPATPPPADLRTMQDPPIYNLHVNQDFYQMHGTVDLARYSAAGWRRRVVEVSSAHYGLPYELINRPDQVLVLGAGGGMDVETALLHGVRHVDAVEIDPMIPAISRRISASDPYGDPRVTLHIDDARAYLQRSHGLYDLVAFGYLDSQALFSYGANLRLDGYIHTVESYRKAYEHVREGGAMVVWFYAGRDWLNPKLVQMTREATGQEPYVYLKGGGLAIITPKGGLPRPPPEEVSGWKRTPAAPPTRHHDLATDDWPYLYLEGRGIPTDYAIVIILLLVISVGGITAIRRSAFGAADGHFLFMGLGFLLLQTKSIGDCSLYFGTTWLVTTLVITGVLLMVLLANWVALRHVRGFHRGLFIPLFLSLILLHVVPRETILALNVGLRLTWTLLVVPLPVFFAGLIFSTTFRSARNPSALLGANMIGATIGGFCEYLNMLIGQHQLGYLILAAYAASLLCIFKWSPGGSAAPGSGVRSAGG